MTRHTRGQRETLHRFLPALLVLVAVLTGSAGCGDHGRVQSQGGDDWIRPKRVSVDGIAGKMRLKHVNIETPSERVHQPGGNAGLFLTLANEGVAPDTLTTVTTPDAPMVVYRDGAGTPTERIAVEVFRGRGQQRSAVSLQRGQGPHLELVGLRRPLTRHALVAVTFTFANNGSVTLNVPVQVRDYPVVPPPSTGTTQPS